jgi:LysR family nitrogen assimilation transcriptional regulator
MNAVNFPVWRATAALQSEAREKALGLRELRYFLSVAQTGNIGRAARDLNVSQPAISLQLRKLEEGLGTPLLLRHGRGVTLTPAGTCLRDRLQTVMQLLATPLDEPAIEAKPTALSFAIPADSGGPLMAPIARMFRSRWPDMTLDVREGSGADLEEWLLHRHVDLAILQDPPTLLQLHIIPLLTEDLGLVAPAHASLAQGSRPLPMRDLAGDALILPDHRHWIRRRLDHAAQQCGLRLSPMLQVNSIALTKVLVRGGLGHTILPRAAAREEIERGALAFRPIGQPPLSSTCVLAFHRAASNSPVTAFADMVRDAVIALAESGAWPGAQVVRSIPGAMEQPRGRAAVTPPVGWNAMEGVAIG